ncbi:hypothetical protein AC578_6273 [Lecanosticta acicola]|uniref:Uncharacterized protein n=1 Tax=Lecanosticta acicola TaxID=111012 RepID=A0AAI8W145_9PEZI|nr:hypothetical protein AC578_6273 [Lecanosticta acicola]
MADRPRPQQESRSSAFVRGAGEVRDPEHKLWAPARWVASLIQSLVAVIIVTIGEGLKSIIKGEPRTSRNRHARSD